MMIALSTLFLSAALSPQVVVAPASSDKSWIAITRDGVRLEVVEKPKTGALQFQTPYGNYFTPLDPVAVVLTFPSSKAWKAELATNPSMSLMTVLERMNGDGRIADLIGLTSQLEALWLTVAEDMVLQRSKELVAASHALRKWGSRLDPMPNDMKSAERVEWLWEKIRKAEGPEALLFGGRLLKEVIPAQAGVGDRQISITELKRAMDSKNPYLVHVAALLAGHQHVMDAMLGAVLLDATINHKHPGVREGCAVGIVKLWPNHARQYWADVLFRWKDELRIRAAWHLVDHLPKQAEAPLVVALAAKGVRASRKITIGGLTLRVEDRMYRPSNPLASVRRPLPGGM